MEGNPFDKESTRIFYERDPFEAYGLDAVRSGTRTGPNGKSSQRGKHASLPIVEDPSNGEGELTDDEGEHTHPEPPVNVTRRRAAIALGGAVALILGGAGLQLWQLRKADSAILPHGTRLVRRSHGAPPPSAPNPSPPRFAQSSSSDEESGRWRLWLTPPSPPSSRPPPPPPSPLLPSSTTSTPAMSTHELINSRFRRDPYSGWSSVPSAGVLVHCLDGYEDHSQPWLPGTDKAEISASVIFASQRLTEANNLIPTFGCNNGGIIFRPGATRILCGAPGDCGGTCHAFCDSPSGGSRSNQRDQFPGDDCRLNGQPATGLHAWRTSNIGTFLRRVTEFQKTAKRSFYNEILVDPKGWRSRPERSVEAIFVEITPNVFGDKAEVNEEVVGLHRQFLSEFGLSAELNPLLRLDRSNWDSPFRNISSAAVPW